MEETSGKALVTGGTRGIGRGIVEYFARKKIDLVFTYTNSNNAEQATDLAQEITKRYAVRCKAIQHDIRDMNDAVESFNNAVAFLGQIDILVNNAGITRDKNLLLMSEDEWHQVIDTNLNGYFNMCKAAIFSFYKRQSGVIVNISSTAGLKGVIGQTSYSASKAAIMGFTRSLSKEAAKRNVRVNAVAPGFIETDMTRSLPEKYRAKQMEDIPLKKFGCVEDVASLTYFLASAEANYITGQVFVVDGGLTA